jgi:hypothetical protein
MKKTLFTIGVILLSLSASAQYMITTTVNTPEEGESWETSHITDNMGVAYTHNNITVWCKRQHIYIRTNVVRVF